MYYKKIYKNYAYKLCNNTNYIIQIEAISW